MMSTELKTSLNPALSGTGPGGLQPEAGGARAAPGPGEESRAEIYILLARLLHTPPSPELFDVVAGLRGDDSAFGKALTAVGDAARNTTRAAVAEEHENLFVGMPAALLMPYASYYLAGTLFGRPLAKLRIDMVRLGMARQEKEIEPEDHIGPLCEMMAALILGTFGGVPASLGVQRMFFEKHISEWAMHFFSDLAAAEPADFYLPVARLGSQFIEIERRAFEMVV